MKKTRKNKTRRIFRALVKALDLNAKQVLSLQVAGALLSIAGVVKVVNWVISLNLHYMFTFIVIALGFGVGMSMFAVALGKVLEFDF